MQSNREQKKSKRDHTEFNVVSIFFPLHFTSVYAVSMCSPFQPCFHCAMLMLVALICQLTTLNITRIYDMAKQKPTKSCRKRRKRRRRSGINSRRRSEMEIKTRHQTGQSQETITERKYQLNTAVAMKEEHKHTNCIHRIKENQQQSKITPNDTSP